MKSSSKKKKPLRVSILTLFPEMFSGVLDSTLLGKAIKNRIIQVDLIQIRDFASDSHRTVDDKPYGGGVGMLLKGDVLKRALLSVAPDLSPFPETYLERLQYQRELPRPVAPKSKNVPYVIYLSPQGKKLTQKRARGLSKRKHIILVCGHYEGVDERFIDHYVDQEISIGDYVLTGGELASMVLVDAVSRFLPGVVKEKSSVDQDSLEGGKLKYPQYTRPRLLNGVEVPGVLLEGNHKAIEAWRKEQVELRTSLKRKAVKG